ncbi:hypothetical protein XACN24_08225 [Xanthomonas albilineans]
MEAVIGHLKQEHRLSRYWFKGAQSDALKAIGAAVGYSLCQLMRWIAFLRTWIRAIVLAPMIAKSTLYSIGI